MSERDFTPALGRFAPVRFYDLVARLMQEQAWRGKVVELVAPRPDDVIVDVGCGTGTQAAALHEAEPRARIIGIDPDPEMLARAETKAGGMIDLRRGFGDEVAEIIGRGGASVVVSSLVLHQCPMATKRSILESMHAALTSGGRLVIADFGLQRTRVMRLAFRLVQMADGFENTRPNAAGALLDLIATAGFADVREAEVVATPTGSISIYTASRD